MIEVHELVKRYGTHVAVDGVSFEVGAANVFGLLGSNGAGKSSLMRVLVGYLAASSGRATVAGFDVATQSEKVREHLGYLPENAGLYTELRVQEYLRYRGGVKNLSGRALSRAVDSALDRCQLTHVRGRILAQLSKGYRQRVALAAVLLHDPKVLILDEPTVGLDPTQMREIRELVRELGRERTVLFSTHILSEAEAVCDRVVIMDRGRVLADGHPSALAERFRSRDLLLTVLGPTVLALQALRALPEVEAEVQDEPNEQGAVRLRVRIPDSSSLVARAALSRALIEAGCAPVEMAPERGSLDEAFARITSGIASGVSA